MLEPLKHFLAKYKMLFAKMSQDNISVGQTRLNLNLFYDLDTLLSYLLPLLEAVNVLINFAQGKRDVFIYNFVASAKICQTDPFMMYFDALTSYQHECFQVFCDIVDNSFATITKHWVINLNTNIKTLFFVWMVTPIKFTFFYDCWGKSTCL
jgi:hypothetical protein